MTLNLLITLPKVLQAVINVLYWYTNGNFYKYRKNHL